GDAGVVLSEGEVGGHAACLGRLADAAEDERGDCRAADARGVGGGERIAQHGVEFGGVEFVAGGDRYPDEDTGRRASSIAIDPGDLIGGPDAVRYIETRRTGVERREVVVLPSEHRYTGR